jgi:hypothetical protein
VTTLLCFNFIFLACCLLICVFVYVSWYHSSTILVDIYLLCAGIIMARRNRKKWCAHIERDGEVPLDKKMFRN